jgi:hypothetical protein
VEGKGIFISSCSRRQLARRRPHGKLAILRSELALTLLVLALTLLVLALGLGAFIAGRGGV